MRTQQLSDLVELARSKSINEAAKNSHISRQAFSKSLENLEAELGCRLFERTKQGVRLTDCGRTVLSASHDILERLETLYAELADTHCIGQEKVHGTLNIQIAPMLNVSVLPLAFSEFRSCYPNISFFSCESYRQNIIDSVAQSQSTCGILLASKLLSEFFDAIPENIELIELKTYPIHIAMAPHHPLAAQKQLSVKTLRQYPIIVFEVGGTHGVHALSKLEDIEVTLSTNNSNLCENTLNKGTAVMYSFPLYERYGVFPNFRHTALTEKNATFTAFVAINKAMPQATRKIVSSFIDIFARYL